MYYAILKDNKLITPGHAGAELITDVDGPGAYQVRTCRERGGVVEFGSGLVMVEKFHLGLHVLKHPPYQLTITDHKVVALAPAQDT